jgi:hypothetical protein
MRVVTAPLTRDPEIQDGFACWSADDYLQEYYGSVQPDERATLRFLCEVAQTLPPTSTLLEFGCGPTVHHLFAFAERCAEIHLADFVPANLDAVRHWQARGSGAHDWSAFAGYVLECELGRRPTDFEVAAREATTRRRIRRYLTGDARRDQPLSGESQSVRYPGVLCCFCPDSITDDRAQWRRYVRNICSLVAPGGWIVLTALGHTDSYRVLSRRYPSPCLGTQDVRESLSLAGFDADDIVVKSACVDDDDGHGFSEVILTVATRRRG